MYCHGTGKRCPILKAIQQDEALKAKLKAITDPESFLKLLKIVVITSRSKNWRLR
jgi:hypothetical protein